GEYADSLNNIGTLLRELGRPGEGLAYLDRAIAAVSNHADGHFNRGLTMQALSRNQEAVESHDRAVAIRPDLLGARAAACIYELRPMYRDEAELRAQRAAYERRLRALHHGFSDGRALGDFAAHAGTTQPFYLGYQGQDDRELQTLYGSLMCHALAAHY